MLSLVAHCEDHLLPKMIRFCRSKKSLTAQLILLVFVIIVLSSTYRSDTVRSRNRAMRENHNMPGELMNETTKHQDNHNMPGELMDEITQHQENHNMPQLDEIAKHQENPSMISGNRISDVGQPSVAMDQHYANIVWTSRCLPSKHDTLVQRWNNVGPASKTLGQH